MTEQAKLAPEIPPRTGYAAELDGLMEKAQTDIEKTGALALVLDKALEDAEAGLLLRSQDKTPYTKDEIIAQLEYAAELVEKGDIQTGTNAIPSAGALREALRPVFLQPGGKEIFEAYLARFETLDESERQEIVEKVADDAIEDAIGVTDPAEERGSDIAEYSNAAKRQMGESAPQTTGSTYDHLFDPEYEGPVNGGVDAARVAPTAEEVERRATEARRRGDLEAARNDAYARSEDWKSIK